MSISRARFIYLLFDLYLHIYSAKIRIFRAGRALLARLSAPFSANRTADSKGMIDAILWGGSVGNRYLLRNLFARHPFPRALRTFQCILSDFSPLLNTLTHLISRFNFPHPSFFKKIKTHIRIEISFVIVKDNFDACSLALYDTRAKSMFRIAENQTRKPSWPLAFY